MNTTQKGCDCGCNVGQIYTSKRAMACKDCGHDHRVPTAPKLTKAQRNELRTIQEGFAHVFTSDVLRSYDRDGLIEQRYALGWMLTAAGRAALRGES